MSRAKLILRSVIGMISLANMVRASSQPAREKSKNDLIERLSRYTCSYEDCPIEELKVYRAKQFMGELTALTHYGSDAQLAAKLEEAKQFLDEELGLMQILKRRRKIKGSKKRGIKSKKIKKPARKKPLPPGKKSLSKIPSGPPRKPIKQSPHEDALQDFKPAGDLNPKRAIDRGIKDGYVDGDGSPPIKPFEPENDKHLESGLLFQANAHEPQALADYEDGDSSSEEHPPASIKPQYGKMHRLRQYLDEYGSPSDSLSDTTTSGSGTTTTLSSITSDDEDC